MRYLGYFFLVIVLNSCYMSKSLDIDVHVRINMNIPVSIFNNGASSFTANFQESDYQNQFLEGMKSEFQTGKVIPDNNNPEFEVRVDLFTITETTKMHTVNDTTSDDHGKTYELTKLDLLAKGTIVRLKDNVSYNWSASKDKEEKVTSLRSGGQIVTGQNKEKDEYREKEFSSDEAASLARKCGRRSGVSVIKEILRALK